ncbi:MAG: hypothetical protein LBC18_06070 [Opitutaceae bacterium]|jgi:hypothetical protein|nr:hypothetical protein [Opitutaceae bacterium]
MKSKITIAMLCMVAFPAFAGCASGDVTKTAKGYFVPTKTADVEILKTKQENPCVRQKYGPHHYIWRKPMLDD